jgi:hypothetical protein
VSRAGGPGERVIVVLGSHRAGTSAAARLLWLLGLELGPDDQLLPAKAGDNEKGFHEHRAIMEVNEAILRRLGGTWYQPPLLPDGWELDEDLADLRARGRQLIARDFGDAPAWGFKDPRTSLTLAFWRALATPTAHVVCFRHPLAVARSLRARNHIPLEHGVALWTHYTASAILNTSALRRLFLDYEELFSRREEAVAELQALIGPAASTPDPELDAAVSGWLQDDLRHHAPALRELVEDPAMSAEAAELYLLLELAVGSRQSERSLGGGDRSGPIGDALDRLAERLVRAPGVVRV